MKRLVQIQNGSTRHVAFVEEPHLHILAGVSSIYELAQQAIESETSLFALIRERATGGLLDYDAIYSGSSPWQLLLPIDHPENPARCLVSGTGLTHLGSAKNRQSMHTGGDEQLTDSMKMFRWGVEGGKPADGEIGIPPEWFYKGNGSILRGHGDPLDVPPYADDGGEEAEIAGVYLIDANGQPHRIGMAIGNEFSDHKFEKKNYLNLAGSKIRTCSLGPEMVIDPDFGSIAGKVTLKRGGSELWSKEILTGEDEMCHSLRNIEQHHFKFETHRRPGDLHVHYYGACALSFGDGIELADKDLMEISFNGFGRALRNPLHVAKEQAPLIHIQSLK
ncbi:MAG: AraD1 family protein [Luteolibacter sp.]|uniref:AraD1 family protein n=1 Tax=Luteolibacter sp. TaxID=1962973 RepID=UPI003267A221